MRKKRRQFWLSAIASLLLSISPAAAENTLVQVDLAWKHQRAALSAGRLSVTSDLGFEVRLTKAYLTTFALTLLPCKKQSGSLLRRVGAPVLASLWPVRPAYAGHGQGLLPTQLRQSVVENLLSPEPIKLGSFDPPEDNYCQAHYLTGHAILRTQNFPRDIQMIGASLYIEGEFKAPGAAASEPFTIRTMEAFGEYTPRRPGGPHLISKINSRPARLTLIRNLDTLFDGLDFKSLKRDFWGRHVLRNITGSLKIEAGPIMPR